MSDQRTNVADDILDVIEMAIEKKLARLRNNFVRTTIVEMTSDNSLYIVNINGANYSVYSGTGIEFQVGDAVWVHVPDGDYKKAYICAAAFKRDIFQELASSIGGSINSDLARILNNYPSTMYLASNYMRTNDIRSMMANYDTSAEIDDKLTDYVKKSESGGLMDDYYTKDQIDTKLEEFADETDLKNYYNKTEVDNKLVSYATASALSNYYTKVETDTKLEDYVKKTDLNTSLENYDTSDEVNTKLQSYVTNTSLAQTLSQYATLQALEDIIAGDISGLPLRELYLTDTEPENCNDKDVWISAATSSSNKET